LDETYKSSLSGLSAKAGLIDHISPGRLQFTYIAKQQIHNSGFWWSILTGQLCLNPLIYFGILFTFFSGTTLKISIDQKLFAGIIFAS